MDSSQSTDELLIKFFSKLYEANRSSNEREGLVKEALEILEEAIRLDESSRYSILYLLIVNLSDGLPNLTSKDLVNFFLRAHSGLVLSFKKVLKIWLDSKREIINYLDASGNAEHPLANIFILSEVLGLIDPLDSEAYVIRGNIYLNYFKVLKDYEEKSGLSLKVQSERAFKNALELFTKAVSTDVNNFDGYLGLARLHVLAKNLDKAVTYYENALRCRKDCKVLKELAEAYMLKGDKETASKYLEECKEDSMM